MRPHLHLVDGPTPGYDTGTDRLLDGAVRYRGADRLRLDGPQPDDLWEHVRRYGERPSSLGRAGAELVEALGAVGVTGRGGAHFPTMVKWQTVLAAGGGGYIVANAAEGEPASAKDTALLQHRTHLVLDGLAAAAEALGAIGSVIWLHDSARDTYLTINRALAERRAAGLAEPPVRLMSGPEHYLTGESSAVVNALDGGPPLPSFNRIPAARAGVGGLPTLVQNVETLARVALLARTGGYAEQPGPLVTIVSDVVLTVCEFPPHTTLDGMLRLTAVPGPPTQPPQAVLLGGYGGSWLSWSSTAYRTLGRLDGRRSARSGSRPGPRLAEAGASLGAGVIAPLPPDACGLAETAAVLDYLARSSARQCGPCVFGTRALADTMARVAAGTARRSEFRRLTRLIGEVDGRGACGLPDGAARLARTALEAFDDDLTHHLGAGGCRHGQARPVLPIPGDRRSIPGDRR